MEDNKVKFTRSIIQLGDSLATTIPVKLVELMEINKGDTVELVGETADNKKQIVVRKQDGK